MRTVYYANLKKGVRATLKIGDGGNAWLYGTQPGRRTRGGWPNGQRRPTVKEADAWMLKRGFIRWPRKKPLPRRKVL